MTLDIIPENRREFDRALGSLLGLEKDELLDRMGPTHRLGLRVWYFGGPSAKSHDPREVPLQKMREFVRYYAPSAA